MTLGELLSRAYNVLGDDPIIPREFPRQSLVDLVNEGCVQFRRLVEDKWFRQDVPLVAAQAVYNFPSKNVRLIRLAYDDKTLYTTTVQEMQAHDSRWETRTSSEPTRWTSDGQSHDEFLLYPIPLSGTPEAITFTTIAGLELGGTMRWQDGSAPDDATFVNDIGPADKDIGVPVLIAGAAVGAISFTSEFGIMVSAIQVGADVVTLWMVELPDAVSTDEEDLPVKDVYATAPLWYTLWHTHEEEGDHFSPPLADYYRSRFSDSVERARELSSNPLPFIVHKLGTQHPSHEIGSALPWPSFITDDTGSPVNVGFSRGGFFR